MRTTIIGFLTGLMLLFSLLASCTQSAPASATAPATNLTPKVASREPWQKEWESLQAAARKERVIFLATSEGPSLTTAISRAFKKKYGVEVEVATGRATEVAEKITRTQRAGLYATDVAMLGSATPIISLKPYGILERLDSLLVLPEVTDPKMWQGGGLNWIDSEHTLLGFLAFTQPPILFNTDMVKAEEIKSMRNLLNPRWKGRIIADDPTITGSGNLIFSGFAEMIGMDYLRKLAKQEVVFARDKRLEAEGVARGKYYIGLGISPSAVKELTKAGAPIRTLIPREGTVLSSGGGTVCVIRDAPHPNATKLFTNWILSKEGGKVFSEAYNAQSARLDLPDDWIEPDNRRDPTVKYLNASTEAFGLKKRANVALFKDIFGIR